MHAPALIRRLEAFADALPAAVALVSVDEARVRSPSGAWSILEIVNHLLDEEREDFRARLRYTLAGSREPWPPIDPEGWAGGHQYNERDLARSVAAFVEERRASIAWLRSLPEGTDWSRACEHPRLGPVRAGDLLSAWAAHDALHLGRIAKRPHELTGAVARACITNYAVAWGA